MMPERSLAREMRALGGPHISLLTGQVLNSLNVFESRFVKLREDMESLNRAREALDLDTKKDERLVPKLEGM
jgi:hypothetical protein